MKRISLVVALIIAVVASLILLPQEVRADTKTWTGNGGDNYWSNELNWNPIGVPEPTDDITIPGNISESFIVYLDINVTLESSLEIQSYSKLSIIDSVVLDNYGSIVNTGIFGNEGILHNYGDIYNTPSGHFENNNAMDNYEQITNTGAFINNGILANNQLIQSYMESTPPVFNNSGSIYNAGIIQIEVAGQNNPNGIIFNWNQIDNSGIYLNDGIIDNDGGIINNSGDILNGCGATSIGGVINGNPVVDTCTNSPPIANDDIYSTTGDATLNIPAPGVLSNDDDSDGDDLTVIVGICTQPSNGTVTVNQDGSFGYTPNPGFRGDDSFTYEASDGVDKSNTATVNITVNMTGFEQIISRLDNIESKVNKLDIEAFQMPSKTWCTYHISASIGGLPVEIELEQAYAVRQVAPMQFEEVFNFANTHSFGDGHIRVLMDMPDDFDAVLFQFVFVNPDTGLHGTIIIPHEYGDVWEKAKND